MKNLNFLLCLRKIWLRSNTVVHEGEFLNPNLVVRRARDDLDDFKQPNAIESDGLIQCDETLPFKWKATSVACKR